MEKRGMGQSEGDLPGDTTMVAMVASENPLRPFARSLAVRAGRVYMPRHAAPRRAVTMPRRAALWRAA